MVFSLVSSCIPRCLQRLFWLKCLGMSSRNYCHSCRRKHASPHWYGVGDFQYCQASYVRFFKQGCCVYHPSWAVYEDSVHQHDKTGARICSAEYRKDVLAIRESTVFMSGSILLPRMQKLVTLLASTYYFAWPSQAFVLRIVGLNVRTPSPATLQRMGEEVFGLFEPLRVLDGNLIAARARGISSTKNPSERRCGSIRFHQILSDVPGVLAMLARVEVSLGHEI